MFLRINRNGKYKYIQILHNYRKNGKSIHSIITVLGLYEKERYQMIKNSLKDWKRMGRADTIIKELENDIENVKLHGKHSLLRRNINYKY